MTYTSRWVFCGYLLGQHTCARALWECGHSSIRVYLPMAGIWWSRRHPCKLCHSWKPQSYSYRLLLSPFSWGTPSYCVVFIRGVEFRQVTLIIHLWRNAWQYGQYFLQGTGRSYMNVPTTDGKVQSLSSQTCGKVRGEWMVPKLLHASWRCLLDGLLQHRPSNLWKGVWVGDKRHFGYCFWWQKVNSVCQSEWKSYDAAVLLKGIVHRSTYVGIAREVCLPKSKKSIPKKARRFCVIMDKIKKSMAFKNILEILLWPLCVLCTLCLPEVETVAI